DPWYDTTSNKWKFTTYERDSESQNDYALARYYVNRMGRFNSPDPLSGSINNPQMLNRYAYTIGDPINSSDPTGLFVTGVDRGLQGLYLSAAQVAAGIGGNCTMDGIDTACQMVEQYLESG